MWCKSGGALSAADQVDKEGHRGVLLEARTQTRRPAMAQNRMMPPARLEQLQGADTDVLRRVLEHTMQRLIGAAPHERASTRTTYRNGYRERILDTGSGRLELQIPKLRTGSFFPTLLEPRLRIDRALLAVVQDAYVLGISTRKVDDLMAALGGCSISRSEVSRICAPLDA